MTSSTELTEWLVFLLFMLNHLLHRLPLNPFSQGWLYALALVSVPMVVAPPFGRDAVPQLVLSLRNSREDVDVRIGTAAILGQIGPEAADAVQDLKNLLNDPQLGEAAAPALKQIDHPASTAKD
jgi:hypothetical protein